MRAGISASRLDTAPESFRDYTGRFRRTYAAHGISRWYLRGPAVLLTVSYRPLSWLRRGPDPAESDSDRTMVRSVP
jgi:hypothetical protein